MIRCKMWNVRQLREKLEKVCEDLIFLFPFGLHLFLETKTVSQSAKTFSFFFLGLYLLFEAKTALQSVKISFFCLHIIFGSKPTATWYAKTIAPQKFRLPPKNSVQATCLHDNCPWQTDREQTDCEPIDADWLRRAIMKIFYYPESHLAQSLKPSLCDEITVTKLLTKSLRQNCWFAVSLSRLFDLAHYLVTMLPVSTSITIY